ncbi:MAG: CoA transferase [Solirubrobacterales bacterium]|nr:CoA transferase [Solirubrobacterales bacterium]
MNGTPLPLAGVNVLDLSSLYAAPLIATNLGDFGATVVKVEHPDGDAARRWGRAKDGVPLWWKVLSRNKRLIALDLHDAGDRELVRELCGWADVVIENFRPGRMESWGLGYQDLRERHPGLIMVRVTGFGQYGPYADRPGFGTLAEAFSGFAHITGQPDGPPTLPPFGLADGVAALSGSFAAMLALYWRDTRADGVGQVIDLSLYEPLFNLLGPQTVEYSQLGVVQSRTGNRSPRTAPRNAYRTLDHRWVAVSAGTQQVADRMFGAIGRPELSTDARFSDPGSRTTHADALDKIFEAWVAAHTLKDVLRSFEAAQAPIAPIYDIAQILGDPHYRARESVVDCADDDLGTVTMQNVTPRLSHTPGRIRQTGRTEIGADRDQILIDVLGRLATHSTERG